MTKKISVKAQVRDALNTEKRTRKDLHSGTSLSAAATLDSFVNYAHKLGVGSDNVLTSGSYGYNPITRNRVQLEWMHRGSWLAGTVIDVVADDMTRAGVDFEGDMKPNEAEEMEATAQLLDIWGKLNSCEKWGRLYGGAIAVMLIDGQDMKTPLRAETVGKDQFKGLVTFDRWMVEPSLEDLVTDFGPYLGMPKYYSISMGAPSLRGQVVHYTRIAFREDGIELPYQQRLTENLWGISVLERLYDRMIAFDSASMGAAQLVFKSHLRTLKVEGLRQIVAGGGPPLDGLMAYTNLMRRFQGIEGMTLLDAEDEFEVQQTSAFSGVKDVIGVLSEQLSGATQIPLVRLLGQSPAGLSATGESDLRNYYDTISQKQNKGMKNGVLTCYKLIAQSLGFKLPENFGVSFTSLWQLNDKEKAEIAKSVGESVSKAMDDGIIGRKTALLELRQSSRITNIFSNISDEAIDSADDEVQPPLPEGHVAGPDGMPIPDPSKLAAPEVPGEDNGEPNGPQGKKKPVGGKPARRVALQH